MLNARNEKRAQQALNEVSGAESVVTADLGSIEETIQLALQVNALGTFDAVIHNAGIYNTSPKELFTVNTLAPYILTSLIQKPKRLIYLSSDMYEGGHPKLESFKTDISSVTYSDRKLHVLILCLAVGRKWKDVYANAVNPGWVPTKMGGGGAPDDLQKGYETQVWVAVSKDDQAMVSGKYFHHKKARPVNKIAADDGLQEQFLKECENLTGIAFPE